MIRLAASRIFFLTLALLPLGAGATETPKTEFRQRAGDDPRWAARDWNDRDWTPNAMVPARSGIWWLRYRFTLSPDRRRILGNVEACVCVAPNGDAPIDSVFLPAPFSYELYWDGRLIGGSGVVGATREAELTGPLDHVFVVPNELLGPGEHVMAMRLSAFHYNFPAREFLPGISLINFAEHFAAESRRPVFPLVGVGGAALVAVISGLVFILGGRWRPLLLCSLTSLALAIFYLLIAWRWIHNDPYEWFCPRLIAITWVMTAIAVLFPWLLLEQFVVPRRGWWLLALAPFLGAAWSLSPIYEIKALWLCRAMLGLSAVIAGWAAWRGRAGARCMLGGVLIALVSVRAGRRDFLDPTFFATFGTLVLFVFAALSIQLRRTNRRARDALLMAARLETELLKKNLQPHFLLNTLAVLTEIVEQDPRAAVRLIGDLADEFRSVARVAAEKLIPLAQELELCSAHLRVMSVRLGRPWRLEASGVDGATLVPPAVFLTLIENGFVHQRVTSGPAVFGLRMERETGGTTRYRFHSPGDLQEPAGRPAGGSGLRYVKARLEESFPGRWSLRGEPATGGWQTVIEIKTHGGAGRA